MKYLILIFAISCSFLTANKLSKEDKILGEWNFSEKSEALRTENNTLKQRVSGITDKTSFTFENHKLLIIKINTEIDSASWEINNKNLIIKYSGKFKYFHEMNGEFQIKHTKEKSINKLELKKNGTIYHFQR